MKPADSRWIDEMFATPDPWARPSDDCPDLDRLRAAAAAELPLEERRSILDHSMRCPYCTESWRLALRLGARPKMPFWVHYRAILLADLRVVLEASRRLAHVSRFFTDRSGVQAGRWRLLPQAAGAGVFLAIGLALLLQDGSEPPGRADQTRGAAEGGKTLRSAFEIRSLVAEDQLLPRDRFVLRWSGLPPGTLCDLRVTTARGELVDSAADLAEPEYQVPAEKLSRLETGAALFWYVSSDGLSGPRFRVQVE